MVREITNKEVLEISLKIEKEGARFYHELSKHISDSKVHNFLKHMAKEEGEHEKRFKDLLSEKGGKPYGWEKDEEFRHLVDHIFQTDIFPKLDELFNQLPEFEGFQKALDFAIESERVSAEFYSLLGQNCENLEAKTALLLLEKEELEHLDYVQSLKNTFK